MCRWIVYQGPPILMSRILLDPGHSLLAQALQAREIEWPTNADGFGVGWYHDLDTPGVVRDVLPIWNDENLRSIARHVRSRLFFAHVRKATAGDVQRSNCHPFAHGRWLFQHNGSIPSFGALRRRLHGRVAPGLFPEMRGSTDSECLFLIALSNGLDDDPPGALARTIRIVEDETRGEDEPFHFAASVSDGERTWAVRHASAGEPRSLYYSTRADALCDFESCSTVLPEGAVVVASEPLGRVGGAWERVEPGAVVTVGPEGVRAEALPAA